MAQAEDTELRDLVIEVLEKNGSLAKIRSLLRANIFLAFEDEFDNVKQNMTLNNMLDLPEGILCLSIIHEFLEYCNLKNTLFVYKSESRQGKDYNYEGRKFLCDKLNLAKRDSKEPVLVSLMKTVLKPSQRKYFDSNHVNKPLNKGYDHLYKDEQNCTYIVHEDSSSGTSNSQSDNSSDEKNKLHLRLQLDNSDTDTSSDSARDKTSSEYIPNDHVIVAEKDDDKELFVTRDNGHLPPTQNVNFANNNQENISPYYLNELKIGNISSSDSTSYVELKPFSSIDEKLLNTTGVPVMDNNENLNMFSQVSVNKNVPDLPLLSTVSVSSLNENSKSVKNDRKLREESKSDAEAEYSYDFSSPSPKKEDKDKIHSPESVREDISQSNKNSSNEAHQQNSASSQSSVSISDVADLISEKSFSFGHPNKESEHKSKTLSIHDVKKVAQNDDDSGDFSESPIPSLSNLSLDIHSD